MTLSRRQAFAFASAALLAAPAAQAIDPKDADTAATGPDDPRWSADPRLAQLWVCTFRECPGYIYDPVLGEPRLDIPPGTAFQDLPAEFRCPECASGKIVFRRDVNRATL